MHVAPPRLSPRRRMPPDAQETTPIEDRLTAELDDAAIDLPGVPVFLAVRQPDRLQSKPFCGSGGHEQVGAGADPVADGVLEQPMGDGHGGPEQVAARSDRL